MNDERLDKCAKGEVVNVFELSLRAIPVEVGFEKKKLVLAFVPLEFNSYFFYILFYSIENLILLYV